MDLPAYAPNGGVDTVSCTPRTSVPTAATSTPDDWSTPPRETRAVSAIVLAYCAGLKTNGGADTPGGEPTGGGDAATGGGETTAVGGGDGAGGGGDGGDGEGDTKAMGGGEGNGGGGDGAGGAGGSGDGDTTAAGGGEGNGDGGDGGGDIDTARLPVIRKGATTLPTFPFTSNVSVSDRGTVALPV